MNTERLSSLGIRIDRVSNTVADFISFLLDATKKAERDALKTKEPAMYYGLLLMVFQEQHGLIVSPLVEAEALKLDGFPSIKKVIGDYPVLHVDTDEAVVRNFQKFLSEFKPTSADAIPVLKNGSTALDGVSVLEKIFNKPYNGDIKLFTDHCIAAWLANVREGAPNRNSLPEKMKECKVTGLLSVFNQLTQNNTIRWLTEEELSNVSSYCDLTITDITMINKAAKDLEKALSLSDVPDPIPQFPPKELSDPLDLPAPISMKPVQDYDDDIDETVMLGKTGVVDEKQAEPISTTVQEVELDEEATTVVVSGYTTETVEPEYDPEFLRHVMDVEFMVAELLRSLQAGNELKDIVRVSQLKGMLRALEENIK
jgi:hypothetical protein